MEQPQSDYLDSVTLFANLTAKHDQHQVLLAARAEYQDLKALWESIGESTRAHIKETGGNLQIYQKMSTAHDKYLQAIREYYDFL